jgi:DUF4097 and DUF4098 domain-containing protein YvlB
VKVIAERRSDVNVHGKASLTQDGSRLTLDGGPNHVEVRVPEGVDIVVGTTSGRVDIEGDVGSAAIVTDSGRVALERARAADVRTNSGRVEIGQVAERSRVRSRSGRVIIDATAEADVATKSGRISLRSVTGRTHAHCVSGRIEISLADAADVEAETVSGRITVQVPRHLQPTLLDGPLPASPSAAGCTIATRSVSGRVVVERP